MLGLATDMLIVTSLVLLGLLAVKKVSGQKAGVVIQCPDKIDCDSWQSFFDFNGFFLNESLACLNHSEQHANISSFTVQLMDVIMNLDKQDFRVI